MGFARTEDDLYLRDTHFPNEVIVRPLETPNFTQFYISELNRPPTREYSPKFQH